MNKIQIGLGFFHTKNKFLFETYEPKTSEGNSSCANILVKTIAWLVVSNIFNVHP